jgi:hypothetical protein
LDEKPAYLKFQSDNAAEVSTKPQFAEIDTKSQNFDFRL